ncbi:MAG: IS1096 element passenger TnpR family protein [Desulfomonilaceae bacterium]
MWRAILVSPDTRLSELHKILQVVMGWRDAHLHEFEVQRGRSF